MGLNWLTLGIIGAAIAVAFGAGWSARDARCDAAALREQLDDVNAVLARTQDDLEQSRALVVRLDEEAAIDADLDRKAEETLAAIPRNDRQCLDGAQLERLRRL